MFFNRRRQQESENRMYLNAESLEDRYMLNADFGFSFGVDTFTFQVVGTNDADTITFTTNDDGDNSFFHWVEGDEFPIQSGEIAASDIATFEALGFEFLGFEVISKAGDDTIEFNQTNWGGIAQAGSGDDVIYGSIRNDVLRGASGNDLIDGNKGDDLINGGSDNDLILGGEGEDRLFGSFGNDVISGGEDNDMIRGGGDDDLIAGDAGMDELMGGDGDDTVIGDNHDTVLRGEMGDDQLLADANTTDGGFNLWNDDNEKIDFSQGFTYSFEGLVTPGDPLAFDNWIDSTAGPVGGVEIMTGGGMDTIYGSPDNDIVSSGDGDDIVFTYDGEDTVDAGAGDDMVSGGADADNLDGGDGEDLLTYEDAASGVRVSLDDGRGTLGDAFGDTVMNFENLKGSFFGDWLEGDSGVNKIYGLDGSDSMFGLAGDDYLMAGEGDDIVDGGAGNDVAYGEDGNDILRGRAGDDSLFGGEGNDRIHGNVGADSVSGGAGEDILSFLYVGGEEVIDDVLVFGGSDADLFRAVDASSPLDEFTVRVHLQDPVVSDFDANDDDELRIDLA